MEEQLIDFLACLSIGLAAVFLIGELGLFGKRK